MTSDPSNNDSFKKLYPWIVQDPERKREWLLPEPLLYYVHERKDGKWVIIDRSMDMSVGGGPYRTREQAIRAFYKGWKRPVPTGTKLPRCADSNYSG